MRLIRGNGLTTKKRLRLLKGEAFFHKTVIINKRFTKTCNIVPEKNGLITLCSTLSAGLRLTQHLAQPWSFHSSDSAAHAHEAASLNGVDPLSTRFPIRKNRLHEGAGS